MSQYELTRSRVTAGILAFRDGGTDETVMPLHDVFFEDDFLGAGSTVFPTAATAGTAWGKKIVHTAGTVTVAAVANGAGGVVALALDATSEKQDAVLYFLDQLGLDASKIGGFETRIKLPVVPSATGVEAVVGLHSAWIDGPLNGAEYVMAGFSGSGALLFQTQDGTTQTSNAVTSGLVLSTTDWHTIRVNFDNPADLRIIVDGADVTPTNGGAAIPFAATGTSAVLQPYMAVYKPSGTGVATMDVDYFRVWTQRQ